MGEWRGERGEGVTRRGLVVGGGWGFACLVASSSGHMAPSRPLCTWGPGLVGPTVSYQEELNGNGNWKIDEENQPDPNKDGHYENQSVHMERECQPTTSGGTERDWEQTAQGGSGGWIRHRALGTALEQPVPRNTSEEEEEDDGAGVPPSPVDAAATAAWPLGTEAAIGGETRPLSAGDRDDDERRVANSSGGG
uniref:Uncharacterized protein n=1 Tax=Oryza punctata TaxID=4537 RepID=A0A0E0MPL4_ORYPU